MSYVPYIYDIDSLKEPKRTTIVRPGLTLVAHNAVITVMTKKKQPSASGSE
jgi:hypothetical protein